MVNVHLFHEINKYEAPENAFRHLELGASNYGPDFVSEDNDDDYKATSDSRFDVLITSISYVIMNNPANHYVLYLNDINDKGLHIAMIYLRNYCLENFNEKI